MPRAFTLVELMIVVAICGILAAIAIPAFAEYSLRSKLAEAPLCMDGIMNAAAVYDEGIAPGGGLATGS